MNKRSLLTAVTALMLICGTVQGQSLAPDNFERQPMDRMAAWNYSLVRTYELAPVSRLLTYVRENYGIQYTALARIVPQIEIDGKTYSASQAENIQVEDFPGGVVARFTLGGVRVETRFTPLLVGQGEPTRVGAAVYRIETTPATPVQLIVGESYWQRSAFEDMNKSPFTPLDAHDNRITRQEGTYLIRTAEHGAITGVRTKASVTVQSDGKKGEFMECSLPKGSGELLLTFAEDPDRVLELSEMNPDKALANVKRHYDELLSNRIETPDTLLNQAFASALLTLEYTWVPPYGWMECIHHWTSMWHMQQTVAAEWLGQTDRSRITTLTQGELINSDGSIPIWLPSASRAAISAARTSSGHGRYATTGTSRLTNHLHRLRLRCWNKSSDKPSRSTTKTTTCCSAGGSRSVIRKITSLRPETELPPRSKEST